MNSYTAISLAEKVKCLDDFWSPKIVASLNDYHVKVVKLKGSFTWHQHVDTDELFLVLAGKLVILFRDGQVELRAGELFVVPKGIEHKPVAEEECHVVLIEPPGIVNTGDNPGPLTAETDAWI